MQKYIKNHKAQTFSQENAQYLLFLIKWAFYQLKNYLLGKFFVTLQPTKEKDTE